MNAKDYEYEDLKDIRKETTIGFNVTIYPNTVYNARDNAGAVIFDQGQRIKQVGTTISSGIQFGYVNENRDIKATIGNGVTTNFDTQGVNRDIEKAVGDWQGINIETFSMDLGTEYWLTQAGRGTLADQIDDAKRGYKGLKDILSSEGKFSDLVKGEKFVRRLEELGIFDIKGKTEEDITAEIRARASHLLDSDLEVDVKFYGEDDLGKITDLTTLAKLTSQGFAVASDGSIWVNTEVLGNNNTLDFNKLLAHELGHLMGGNETIANYMEKSYGEFVGGVGSNGYVDIGGSIRDWGENPLSGDDANRLLGYKVDEIEFKIFNMTPEEAEKLKVLIKNLDEMNKRLLADKGNEKSAKTVSGIINGTDLGTDDKSFMYPYLKYYINSTKYLSNGTVDVDLYLLNTDTGEEEILLNQFVSVYLKGNINLALATQYDAYKDLEKKQYADTLKYLVINDVYIPEIGIGKTVDEVFKSKAEADFANRDWEFLSNMLILSVLNDGNSAQMENISGNAWWIPKSSGKVSSYKSDTTLTTYKPVDTLDKQNFISIDKNLNSQNSSKSQITVVKKGYTSDQRAVIELAKEAKAQGGLKAEEAKTLQKWANEYGVPNHGPEIHPNRPGAASNVWHIHIGKTGHIQIID